MAVRINYRHVYECDTEAERDLSWPIEALIYCLDSELYYKQEFGDWTVVPTDEIFFTSPIPIDKLAFSGTPSEEKYLRSDGSWAEPGISGGTRVLFDSWDFDTDTTATDPGSGGVKFNNGAFASVTKIYISDLSLNNNNFSAELSNIDVGDTVYIQEKDAPTNAIRFQITAITDNTDWWTIDVSVVSSIGSVWANEQDVTVLFSFGGGGGGTPGGADTQVQYNTAGAFAGISGATSNGTILSVTTAPINTNTTQVASTEFVLTQIGGLTGDEIEMAYTTSNFNYTQR